jgi:CRISPR system Cascade subunit CasE
MSVWLIRIGLDLRSKPARADISDVVGLHRRVMMLVPDGLGAEARRQAGVLFRFDHTRTGPALLVQTTQAPSPERLPPGYGTFQTRELTPLLDALRPGLPVHYRIAANASKRLWKDTGRYRAKQVVPLDDGDAQDWWQRKAEIHGLRLLSVRADPQPPARGSRSDTGPFRHAITRFDGQAVVLDADHLRDAVVTGIGRGKSYGCGLLSLAPTRMGNGPV